MKSRTEKVLLLGGTGNLGKEIAAELKRQGYQTTAVVRKNSKIAELEDFANIRIANVLHPEQLRNICDGFEIVVSALGKSVSPNDKSKATFFEVDFIANNYILPEALKAKVKKFVYVSAFGAEKYPQLEYFKVHHDFSEELINSGLNYSIIKPLALFSAFLDLIEMARKGRLINIGSGEHLTNPIYEGDLAKICVDSINQSNSIIEAGGKEILNRKEINETIQRIVAPKKKIRTIPLGMFKFGLPLMKIFDKNSYDKFAFFVEVSQHDLIAPQIGEKTLEEYVREKVLN